MEQQENYNHSSSSKEPDPSFGGFLDISWLSIVKVAFALGALYFLYIIGDILIWFIFALIISILFNPAINFLKKLKIPRVLAALFVYFGAFLLLGIFIYSMAPVLFSELQHFSSNLPEYFDQIAPYLRGLRIEALQDFEAFSAGAEELLAGASANIFAAMGAFFGGIFTSVVIFAMALFLSLEEKGLKEALALVASRKHKDKVLEIWQKAQKKVAAWFGVRILCCVFIGIATGLTCYVLDIRYAVAFGIISGLANLVVYIGPLLSGFFIFLFILATASLPKAIIFAIAIYIAQQIESYVIMPILTKRFLRLSPSIVLISLLIGGRLWGIMGAILVIPLIGMVVEFVKGMLEHRDKPKQNVKIEDS